MAKVRVPLHGKSASFAVVNTEATKGATFGVDLYRADGELMTAADLGAAADPIANTSTGAGTASTTDGLPEGANNLYFSNERAQDALALAFAAGTQTGLTIAYNDVANKFDFTVTASTSITASSSVLGADLAIATTTQTDIVTLSLAAGTYILMANAVMLNSGAVSTPNYYLTDGTTYYAGTMLTLDYATSVGYDKVSFSALVTLGSTTTVKFAAAHQNANSITYKAATPIGSRAGATQLIAVKIA